MAEITLTQENFAEEVLQAKEPVLVDFWAVWCGPCKMLAPVLQELAEEYEGQLKVGKVNVDEQMELVRQFGIVSIPTVILFRDGKAVRTAVGFRPKEELEQFIEE